MDVAFQGEIAIRPRERLRRCVVDMSEARTCVEVDLGGLKFEVGNSSRDGWWTLRNGDVSVEVNEKGPEGWRVVVRPSAAFLMKDGPSFALAYAREVGSSILRNLEGIRTRRGDLAVDVVHFPIGGFPIQAWVGRPRLTVTEFSTLARYAKAGNVTGVVAGKGDVVFRAYDKVEELKRAENEGAKRELVRQSWLSSGWDGEAPVTRFEFQLRGDALKEMDSGAYRDPEAFLKAGDSIWGHCASWIALRKVVRGERRTRWAEHPFWQIVRGASFGSENTKPAVRTRVRSTTRARIVASFALSYVASAGEGRPSGKMSAIDFVGGMSEMEAEAFIHDHLDRTMTATASDAAKELIAVHGTARKAARYVVEKQNAACARFASSAEMVARRIAERPQHDETHRSF